MESAVVRNDMATARLVILSAGHAPLLAHELGWAHCYRANGEVAIIRSPLPRMLFREGIKADSVTDRVEIITRLSKLDELCLP